MDGILNTATGPMPILKAMRHNLAPAATVALVSLSLSISLGIASGATPVTGLATAIWGGLTGGLLCSSNYNIIGPAGALAGLLDSYATEWGPEILPWVALISSGFAFIFWAGGLIQYLLFMPKYVFEGFTVGVALIIGLKQLDFALGLSPATKHKELVLNVGESFAAFDTAKWESMVLFFPMTPVLFILMRKIPKIPWMVVLPGLTIILGWLCFEEHIEGWALPTLKTKYGELEPDIVNLPDDVWTNTCEGNETETNSKCAGADNVAGVIMAGFSVAIVAVLETLVSAEIAGTRSGYEFNDKKEALMVAVAHLICGFLGALPPTGVFVRTSINQSLGANHRISQFMNAIMVLIVTAVALPVFSYLPQPSIAAILVVASLRMMPWGYLGMLWAEDRPGFVICWITGIICFVVDPVVGLLLGCLIAFARDAMSARIAARSAGGAVSTQLLETKVGVVAEISITGPIKYANAIALVKAAKASIMDTNSSTGPGVGAGAAVTQVVIDVTHVTYIDTDGLDELKKMVAKFAETFGEERSAIAGCHERIEKALSRGGWLAELQKSGRVFTNAKMALNLPPNAEKTTGIGDIKTSEV
jgi:SulP family sulfate permease